jgi:hypothetical protein
MTQKAVLGIIIAASLSISACATHKVVPDASSISLQDAMKSVGEGLKQMKDAQGNLTTGLLPSEVVVTFNVTASASDGSKLVITSSTQVPQLPVSVGFTGDLSSAISAARGNVVTIKFTNLLFAPEKQFLTSGKPEEIEKIIKILKKEGITIFLQK